MFRRLEPSLPKDPSFPADLEKLGYTIINDVVRTVENTDQPYKYKITSNDRYNDLNKQALKTCIGNEIAKRMAELGAPEFHVPQMTTEKPHSAPHVTIFMTRNKELVAKHRVVVVIPGDGNELGCWSFYKAIEEGIQGTGSSVGLLQALKAQKDSPGLIVLNTNQLNYSYEFNKGLSLAGWMYRQRKTLFTPEHIVDPDYNKAAGNETSMKHVEFVFDQIVNNPDFVSPLAKVDIISIGSGGEAVLEVLQRNWGLYCPRLSAIALVNVWYHPDVPLEKDFREFLLDRGRMWTLSSAPLNVPLVVPGSEEFKTSMALTPVFSGGVDNWSDNILPVAQKVIVDWMQEVAEDAEYLNPELHIFMDDPVEEEDNAVEGEAGTGAEEKIGQVDEPNAKTESKPADHTVAEN